MAQGGLDEEGRRYFLPKCAWQDFYIAIHKRQNPDNTFRLDWLFSHGGLAR